MRTGMDIAQHCVLVTGGAGFIGSNFIPYFLNQHPNVRVINLDKLTYAANIDHVNRMRNHPRYQFVRTDLCNVAALRALFAEQQIDGIVHCAAESHVDNSIAGPDIFIQTNVVGTFNLLEVARQAWGLEDRAACHRFVHVSTDEVYGSLGETGLFTEQSAIAPNSPYSASKAASDLIVRSYQQTYGMNTVITHCSNNYGPGQHAEKLIPTLIRRALAGESLPLYGDGQNVRDWIYVLDHCRALDVIYWRGRSGEVYNIGGSNERSNVEVAEQLCALLDERLPRETGRSYREQIQYVPDRLGHDRRYAIDSSKLCAELGWTAQESFATGLARTVDWFVQQLESNINKRLPPSS